MAKGAEGTAVKLSRSLVCEFLGTAFLLATVVGSGILIHKIDGGIVAISVLSVALATGFVLTALILAFGGISSHFNPLVTVMSAARGELPWKHVFPYIAIQILGASAGVIVANAMFEAPVIVLSHTARTGLGQWTGEFVATFGLIGIILGCGKFKPNAVPVAVGGYVAGAILFTSSTCFANPAVTISRIFTDTLTGIQVADVVPFILAQILGATCAFFLFQWLLDDKALVTSTEAEASSTQTSLIQTSSTQTSSTHLPSKEFASTTRR